MADYRLMTDSSEKSDDTLLQQLRAGSEDAATRLFARYGDRLHNVAEQKLGNDLVSRVDADDIVQSVFRTFFRRAINGEYQVPDGKELWRLLLVIGLNKVKGQAVRHRAQRRDVSRTISTDAAAKSEPDETGFVLLKLAIEEHVESLPEAHQHIVDLRIEGFEIAEIASRSKRSHRTVERVLQQFRSHLHEIIRPEHDDQ
jgi:RNA polymerase sigma-70 factor (ECF subfamily)